MNDTLTDTLTIILEESDGIRSSVHTCAIEVPKPRYARMDGPRGIAIDKENWNRLIELVKEVWLVASNVRSPDASPTTAIDAIHLSLNE